MRVPLSIALTASLLAGCGARAFLDVPAGDTSVSGSSGTGGAGATSSTGAGLGGAGPGTTTSTGAGGAGGGVIELATFDKPVELALDAEYVYVSVRGSGDGAGQVVKVPKGGGAPIVILSDQTKVGHLTVDDTDVFFMRHPKDPYELVRVPKAGGKAKTLASYPGDTSWLAVDAEYLWGVHPKLYSMLDELVKIDKTTGGNTYVGDYTSVWSKSLGPHAVVVDDAGVYWASITTLLKMSKSDEIVVDLLATNVSITRVAQDPARLYFTLGAGTTPVGSVSKQGGDLTWLGEDTKAGTRSLAVRDGYVYWANDVEGTIKRVPKTGGPTTVIASGQGLPYAMAADASGVYWVNLDDGRVMRFVE